MNVVLLAGGNSKQSFNDEIVYKGLTPIGGKPMVRWVVDALRGSEAVDKICILGPRKQLEEVLNGIDNIVIFEGADELFDNIESGLKYFEQDSQLMIATSDIPMIDSEMVTWLVNNFKENTEDFIYPIISREDIVKRFANMHRTYVKVREGEFTGGNISCVRPSVVLKKANLINKLIKYRKRPDKTASLLGFKFVIGIITGRITIMGIEKRAEEIFGITVKALKCPFAEVGSDVDKEDDIPTVEQALNC